MKSCCYLLRLLPLVLSAAAFLLFMTPPAPALAAGALLAGDLESQLYYDDLLEAPGAGTEYLDSAEIPVTWSGFSGAQVTLYTALSPTPLSTVAPEDQPAYLATLTWRVIEEALPNTGSYTLLAGSLKPDNTHLLLVKSGLGPWDVTDGEFTVTQDEPEIPCAEVTTAPSPTPTMQLSGGIWGNANAQWTDLDSQRQPPRTAPQADDIVRVAGNATFSTTTEVAGLIVASGVTLTGTTGTLTVAGPLVNYGTITGNFTTRITQIGAYNLGTSWNNSNLQFYGGTNAGDRRPMEIMADASHLFGNANSKTNGYLEFIGCAALPGTMTFQATNILIDAPSKITLNQAQNDSVISGSGALEIKGSATGTELGIQPAATNGPLQYLIFSGSNTQTIRLNTSTPGGITAQTVQLVNGTKELISTTGTITGDLDILPTTTLRNYSSASKTLTVNGNVHNYGAVSDNTSNTLTVKVSGTVQNSGTWNNSSTEFNGTSARNINGGVRLLGVTTIKDSFQIAESARFGGLTFGYGSASAFLSFPTSLPVPRIEATSTLSGQGGLTRGKLLINNNGDQLIQANLTADRIELTGDGNKRVKTPTFFSPPDPGNLLVDSGTTLVTQSDPVSSQISVWGNITNRGTIRDRPSGSNPALKVYVSANLLNENSWINSNTYALWPSLSGATNYRFEITNDQNNWANPITTSATSRNITSYLTGTPYYWRTRAFVDGVWQDWEQSPVHTINLNHAPVITLQGDDPLGVAPGGTYTEAGATANEIWPPEESISGTVEIQLIDVNNMIRPNDELYTPLGFGEKPLVTLEGAGSLLLTNPADLSIGLEDGAFIDEINDENDDAKGVDDNVSGAFKQHYYFDTNPSDLGATVTGTSNGTYDLVKMMGQQLTRITAVPTATDIEDIIHIRDDRLAIYFDDDPSRPAGNYKIEMIKNYGGATAFTAPALPVMPGATIAFTFDWAALHNGGNGVTVEIDLNSDETVDFTGYVGTLLDAVAPPTTRFDISGTQNPDQSYQSATVMLTPTDDENGIGVAKTEYSQDGGSHWTTYPITNPATPIEFTQPGEITLQYRSTDGLGKVEATKTSSFTISPSPSPTPTP